MRSHVVTGSLAMGALSAVVGALSAVLVLVNATGAGYEWFFLAAPAAAFVTGSFLWWLLVSRRLETGITRGALTGSLAGGVAHFVCWYLVLVASFVCNALTGGCSDSLGQPPMNPLDAVAASATYSAFSLVLFGWFTVAAGGCVGGLLAYLRRRAIRL